jgi:hypothetical protein
MTMIDTLHGLMPEESLLKLEVVIDNDEEYTTSVEYCLVGCDGSAHTLNTAQGEGCFCPKHVHRSVHVTKKKWPEALQGIIKDLTEPPNLDAWARETVAELIRQREEAGAPIEVQRHYSERQWEAIRRVLDETPGVGSVKPSNGQPTSIDGRT